MYIVAVHGSMKKGSTYNIAGLFIERLSPEDPHVREFFLPKDMPDFCTGCTKCFMDNEKKCPHSKYVSEILSEMEKADLLIFTSPVYVYHSTGQMKAFLDHFGFMWMVHRPNEKFFTKKALIISTAAGAGMKSTNKDIKDSLVFWGVSKIYTFGMAVHSTSWTNITDKKRKQIDVSVDRLSKRILKSKPVKPNIKARFMFLIFKNVYRKKALNPADKAYWDEKGWTK